MNDDFKDEIETLQCVYGDEISIKYIHKKIHVVYTATLEINTKISVEFSITTKQYKISVINHPDSNKTIPPDILSQIREILALKYKEEIGSMPVFQCISFCSDELFNDKRLHLAQQLKHIKCNEDKDALLWSEVAKYRQEFRQNGGSSIAYIYSEHNTMQFKQGEYKRIDTNLRSLNLSNELKQILSKNKPLRDAIPSINTVSSWMKTNLFTTYCDITFIANVKNMNRFLNCGASKFKNFSVVFHGTSCRNDESIIRNGLVVGGTKGVSMVNGAAYGRGVYCSPQINTAKGYASGSLFVCLVREQACRASGTIYVVPDDNDILPIYLVSCGFKNNCSATGNAFLKRMKWLIQTQKKKKKET